MNNLIKLASTFLGCGPFMLKILIGGLLFATHFRCQRR